MWTHTVRTCTGESVRERRARRIVARTLLGHIFAPRSGNCLKRPGPRNGRTLQCLPQDGYNVLAVVHRTQTDGQRAHNVRAHSAHIARTSTQCARSVRVMCAHCARNVRAVCNFCALHVRATENCQWEHTDWGGDQTAFGEPFARYHLSISHCSGKTFVLCPRRPVGY